MSFTLKNGQTIGGDAPAFIIAEMSANHLGDFDKAIAIIDAAAEAGADAVKLQTYTADTITLDCDRPEFIIGGDMLWAGQRLYDLYEEAYTPWEWHKALKEHAEEKGLVFFSTPFDDTAVDFLEELDIDLYKLASFEITHLPLIKRIAQTGKPLIFSSGIAEEEDIELALKTMRAEGLEDIALLKCISGYPAPIEDYNLLSIPAIELSFDVVAGLSDHSEGIVAPVVATAFGAKIIEKHLCLDRDLGGPDAAFSLEPAEFKAMVDAVRQAEAASGEATFALTAKQQSGKAFAQSLFAARAIAAGETLSPEMVRIARPGNGLHPKHLPKITGWVAQRAIAFGEPLDWDQFTK